MAVIPVGVSRMRQCNRKPQRKNGAIPETSRGSESIPNICEYGTSKRNRQQRNKKRTNGRSAVKTAHGESDFSYWAVKIKMKLEIVYEEVTIYYGNGASSELNTEVTEIEQLTAENLIAVLAKHNIVSLDTKVNAFEEQETDGEKMIYLDLSKAFREYLKTMTQEGESIIIAS